MLTYGRRIPLPELDYRIEQIDAKTVRDVCTRYIYDKCPALVGIGNVGRLMPYLGRGFFFFLIGVGEVEVVWL